MTVTQLSPAPQAREAAKHNGARNRSGNNTENRNNTEDDVLIPVTGIVDVLDSYAFVRTSGYLAGPNDVYVSTAQIKRYGLRRGDLVTGAARENGSANRHSPLVRLDTINGMDPEEARRRPEFYKLTPLYPQERLRLETEPHILTTRV
ncbi:MAG TPA: transcription termination factor Rho, partial [Pseudonocardiaceae bacterium]|nr:transcription termination factor Rho [Pseudonocardiaceae bacterium]